MTSLRDQLKGKIFIGTSLLVLLACALESATAALKDMGLEVRVVDGKAPLQLGATNYADAADKPISITRADFLMSAFALKRMDGTWLETGNWFACFKPGENRIRTRVDGVPMEKFTAIRFNIGVDAVTDKSDPNLRPADHPLHPLVNGMHWGWQSGYIFMALEGHWKKSDGTPGGFSYHLAGEPNLMQIELPVSIDMATCGTLLVHFDLAGVMRKIDIEKVGDSTHSREKDNRAETVRNFVKQAFSIAGQSPELFQSVGSLPATAGTDKPRVGTPYPLQISQRFPRVILPSDNPLTVEGVALGKKLFNDTKLSRNNTQACVSCHEPALAFTDHGKRFSVGIDGFKGTRNSMALFNLLWQSEFFWDGRAPTLRAQALMPIEDPHEMADKLDNVVAKLQADKTYPPMVQQAFGTADITKEHIGLAIEQFLTTIISQDSKFDRAMRKEATLSTEEQRGLQLFLTEYDPKRQLFGADCFHCHGGNLLTNSSFANNGLDAEPLQLGRSAVTKLDADKGKFRVPSLRNIALTAPYMHDGRFATLEEVVDHYDHGLKRSPTLDPNLAKHPDTGLQLSKEDKAALVAFLKCLTDETLVKSK